MYESQMTELSTYQSVFEATMGNPVATGLENRNTEMGEKSASLIQRAIDAIKRIYANIRDGIKNIFSYIKLSGDEKNQYKDFLSECNNNPEFANKKVTVKNWKDIDREYNSLINEIQKDIEQVKRTEEEMKPSILKTIDNRIASFGRFGKKAMISITLDQLINRAKYDETVARQLQEAIDNDFGLLDALTKDLSKKEIRRDKRKIRMINSRCGLIRRLAGVRKQKSDMHLQAVAEEKAMIKTFIKSIAKSTLRYGDKNTIKNMGKLGASVLSDVHTEVKSKKRAIRSIKRQEKQAAKISKKLNNLNP